MSDFQKEKRSQKINDNAETASGSPSITKIILRTDSKPISRTVRWGIFCYFLLMNIIINLDHGIIPAAETKMTELLLDNKSDLMGYLSSSVFLGTLLGSLIFAPLINMFNRKYLLISSAALCGGCLFIFNFGTSIIYLLYVNRVAVGLFQAFISIYLPVWCNQFGVNKKKALMMALIQIGPPLGVILGYGLTVIFYNDERPWEKPFFIQSIGLWGVCLFLLLFPDKYFSRTFFRVNDEELEKDDLNESLFFEDKEGLMDKKKNTPNSQTPSAWIFCEKIGAILCELNFLLSTIGLSSLFFVLTIIQYWGSDYMEKQLDEKDENKRLVSYAIVCLTSPTLGVALGGAIVTWLGGYEKKSSSIFCLIMSMISASFTIFVPFANSLTMFTVYLWLCLFFGGAIVAPLMGIIISSLPKELSGSGNSFSIFFCNLLGYLPAPSIYGAIYTLDKSPDIKDKRLAMKCCMWYSWFGVFLLFIVSIIRNKKLSNIEKRSKLIDDDRKPTEEKKERKLSTESQDTLANISGIQLFNGAAPFVGEIEGNFPEKVHNINNFSDSEEATPQGLETN